jgi:hypothetical protein
MALTYPTITPGSTLVSAGTTTITGLLPVRGSAADFTSENPTLAAGRMGYETDSHLLKIGDGETAWTSLDYFEGSGGSGATSGAAAPVTTPVSHGEGYVATTPDDFYVATGTATSADWKRVVLDENFVATFGAATSDETDGPVVGAAAAVAIASDAGVSKVWATDAAGDPDYLDIDNVDEATLAQLLAGTEGVIPSAATLKAAREWTVFAPVANVVRQTWAMALNRTITTAANLTLTFDAVDGDWAGDRLVGGHIYTNTHGSTITVTVTNGDGDPDAPTVMPDAATSFDVTAGDRALIHFETLPDGTVLVLHRITL